MREEVGEQIGLTARKVQVRHLYLICLAYRIFFNHHIPMRRRSGFKTNAKNLNDLSITQLPLVAHPQLPGLLRQLRRRQHRPWDPLATIMDLISFRSIHGLSDNVGEV